MRAQQIAVVGGGPAGMMAAIAAALAGAQVTLLEKNPSCGRKLLLTGKGRCNLTNAGDLDTFLSHFSRRGEFLRDAFRAFFNTELMKFFEQRGVALKTERQLRVFPESDSSASILSALTRTLVNAGVSVRYGATVRGLIVTQARAGGVHLADGSRLEASRVIVATGGLSYRFTGSSGDGFVWAQQTGHRIEPLHPGLVPLLVSEEYVRSLEGITLKNIRIRFTAGRRHSESEIGEMVFSAQGISGPLVFTHSAEVGLWCAAKEQVTAHIDTKPALTALQLDARIMRECAAAPRSALKTVMAQLLPKRMAALVLARAGIDGSTQSSQLTRLVRQEIVRLLKDFSLSVTGTLAIEEAMVTCGGVSTRDINPRTMESKLVKGLFFAGEVIDVDADTGGYNLQAAFSTGYLAGKSAAL